MRIDDLILELEKFKEKHGNAIVRYYDEVEEKDYRIADSKERLAKLESDLSSIK